VDEWNWPTNKRPAQRIWRYGLAPVRMAGAPFRFLCPQGRGGSSPPSPTTIKVLLRADMATPRAAYFDRVSTVATATSPGRRWCGPTRAVPDGAASRDRWLRDGFRRARSGHQPRWFIVRRGLSRLALLRAIRKNRQKVASTIGPMLYSVGSRAEGRIAVPTAPDARAGYSASPRATG
jgi:hypothetical protein